MNNFASLFRDGERKKKKGFKHALHGTFNQQVCGVQVHS